ncbi:hypothetical protein Y032_0305g1954 [Ancylostoma ceylanicum]|uniref:Uncharacterized protein n=1 Tax=Ancylostoma ceylanicum TaxID=53326 RepID=A0A016S3Q7_9BILA|nr:hypothetical protein Y032_0305g1954 [Ancylostoma ceylanicum]
MLTCSNLGTKFAIHCQSRSTVRYTNQFSAKYGHIPTITLCYFTLESLFLWKPRISQSSIVQIPSTRFKHECK